MEEQVNHLVNKTWRRFQDTPPERRLMIAISGIPGSGKTTLAKEITRRLNVRWHASQDSHSSQSFDPLQSHPSPNQVSSRSFDIATFVPMDGYHLTRAQLSAMPDPVRAHARRGAAFTFDAPAFLLLVQNLCQPLNLDLSNADNARGSSLGKIFYAPSFDHAVKDPVADDIPIPPTSRIVIFEGNYLSLGTGAPEWKIAAGLMDELWFVQVEESVARQRLIKRHVASGIAEDEEAAGRRADENDLVNGREIIEGRLRVDEIIESREDDAWRPELHDHA